MKFSRPGATSLRATFRPATSKTVTAAGDEMPSKVMPAPEA